MKDIITYCPDSAAFLAEMEQADPSRIVRDENDVAVAVILDKTPTIRRGAETLAVVRVDDATLAKISALTTIRVIAEAEAYGDLLATLSTADRAIYDRVYPRTPIDIKDDAGNVIRTDTPPALIGCFA